MARYINTGKSLKYTPQESSFSGLVHQYSMFLHCNAGHARALHTTLSCLSPYFEAVISSRNATTKSSLRYAQCRTAEVLGTTATDQRIFRRAAKWATSGY